MANVSVSKSKGSAGGSKNKKSARGSWWGELLHVGLYKPSQGRITRQATFAVCAAVVTLGSLRLWNFMQQAHMPEWLPAESFVRSGLPAVALLLGWWLSFRLVNFSRFADFLVAVEAEMNKVSWPSRTELIRSSIVVIIVMLSMAVLLFGFDFVWRGLFVWLGVIHQG